MNSALADLIKVARRFQELQDRVILVGGYAVFLLVDPNHQAILRTTNDVDYVVKASSYSDYCRLSERMRELGFHECSEADNTTPIPICRWVVEGVLVDVMPSEKKALGFSNRWYPLALENPSMVEVEPGLFIFVVNPIVFLGTKFEALADRGGDDLLGDTDLEDIVTVVTYGKEVVAEFLNADPALREYLKTQTTLLLSRKDANDLVGGCLPANSQSQALVPRVIEDFRIFTGSVITLSQEDLDLLTRSSLISGKGGHQNYFRTLARYRSGNRQAISSDQVKQARERQLGAGTWQAAYSAILCHFPISIDSI